MKAVQHDLIKQRAYEIWEEKGRPDGHDKAHWAQAEQELLEIAPTIVAKPETGRPAFAAVADSETNRTSEAKTKPPSRSGGEAPPQTAQ